MSLRLNLGAGGQRAPGWTSVDRAGDVDVLLDIANDPWPWSKASTDGIVMHHLLDLLAVNEIDRVLRRCHEVLKPGGLLRISCADLYVGVEAALAGDLDWFPEPRATMAETVGWFLTQGQARRTVLDYERMENMLTFAGFGYFLDDDANTMIAEAWIFDLDSRQGESWFMNAMRS